MHSKFLDVPIPMAQVMRLYIQMFVSYGLYVYINLEIAHHRTFRIVCNITQNNTSEENSQKMFHISSLTVLHSYGKVKDALGDKDKILSGENKRKSKRGMGGSPK